MGVNRVGIKLFFKLCLLKCVLCTVWGQAHSKCRPILSAMSLGLLRPFIKYVGGDSVVVSALDYHSNGTRF